MRAFEKYKRRPRSLRMFLSDVGLRVVDFTDGVIALFTGERNSHHELGEGPDLQEVNRIGAAFRRAAARDATARRGGHAHQRRRRVQDASAQGAVPSVRTWPPPGALTASFVTSLTTGVAAYFAAREWLDGASPIAIGIVTGTSLFAMARSVILDRTRVRTALWWGALTVAVVVVTLLTR